MQENVDTLAFTLLYAKNIRLGENLGDVAAEAPVSTVPLDARLGNNQETKATYRDLFRPRHLSTC